MKKLNLILSNVVIATVSVYLLNSCGTKNSSDVVSSDSSQKLSATESPTTTATVKNEICERKIYFLPQTHETKYSEGIDQDLKNRIAESQCNIAKYIDTHSSFAVFSEQATTKDYSFEQFPKEKVTELNEKINEMMNSAFPTGLPQDCAQMTELQKQKFIDNGADFIQMLRLKISVIYKVLDSENEFKSIFDPIDSWFNSQANENFNYPPNIRDLIYNAREKAALRQINKYFNSNPNQKNIILIFGSNHNFSFYNDIFPAKCISVPDEFIDKWSGQFRVN